MERIGLADQHYLGYGPGLAQEPLVKVGGRAKLAAGRCENRAEAGGGGGEDAAGTLHRAHEPVQGQSRGGVEEATGTERRGTSGKNHGAVGARKLGRDTADRRSG